MTAAPTHPVRSSCLAAGLLLLLATAPVLAVDVVTYQQFEAATLPAGGWGFWTGDGGTVAISTNAAANHGGSAGSVKGSYPARSSAGGGYVWCGYDVSALATRDLYLDFWAKMPTATKQGLKFLKVFGARPTSGVDNYANTTFGLDYTGVDVGGMYCVSFGDGSQVTNDTANVVNFDGSSGSWIGRSYGTAVVSTPQNHLWASSNWGTSWHHFRMHVRFNSGTSAATEVADGAYFVEIDGLVYVDARNLFNRHWSNGPIDRIELFGWTQTGTTPFELWYDDVRITTGGFVTATNHAPVAQAQAVTTSVDTAKTITLAASDADGDGLSYAIATPPAHGALSGSGAGRTYTPAAGYSGGDSFTFTANDGQATSAAATVSITVSGDGTAPPRPAAPHASDAGSAQPTMSGTTEAGARVRIYDNGVLVASVTADGSGAWSWTPTTAFAAGAHAITVTAQDAAGNTSAASPATTVTVAAGGGAGGGSGATSRGTGDSGSCGLGGAAALLGLLSLAGWSRVRASGSRR